VLLPFCDSLCQPCSAPRFAGFAVAAVYAIAVGLVMRKKLFAKSAEALRSDPRKAFNQWEAANITGFSCAMNPTIYWRQLVGAWHFGPVTA
jgi:hypothetical protein